jgi:hypothetical protein
VATFSVFPQAIMSANVDPKPSPALSETLRKAGKRALGGGLPGAAAMVAQVSTLMWLRTTMNYQYRHGTTTMEALKILYADGGVLRFYRGYWAALIQGPVSRFGDTAANAGMLSLMDSFDSTRGLPISVKTMSASAMAATIRLALMPIDTIKTIMQVEGKRGIPTLTAKFRVSGPSVFFHGALASATATFVGHFPWFYTHNLLNDYIPRQTTTLRKLGRNAFIGFCSSVMSDVTSNSIRVIKTTKQSAETALTYKQAIKLVVDKDGVWGLFFRGLNTRILANAMQGMMFTVIWKGLEEKMREREKRQ